MKASSCTSANQRQQSSQRGNLQDCLVRMENIIVHIKNPDIDYDFWKRTWVKSRQIWVYYRKTLWFSVFFLYASNHVFFYTNGHRHQMVKILISIGSKPWPLHFTWSVFGVFCMSTCHWWNLNCVWNLPQVYLSVGTWAHVIDSERYFND